MVSDDLPTTEAERPPDWTDSEWREYLEWKNSLVPFDPEVKGIHLEAISKPKPKPR